MAAQKQNRKKKSREPSGANGNNIERHERELKEHVLQARVSKTLYRDLAEQAKRLRVPISNLVRNILEDSVRMVGNIVESSFEIAEALRDKVDKETIASVLGWQRMVANKRLACAQCGNAIEKGSEAFIGVGAPGSRTIVICEGCKCKM